MDIVHLYTSPAHNYFGHKGRAPDSFPDVEVSSIECVTGRGIRGDRFFDYREAYKGQITFFAEEVFGALCEALAVEGLAPSAVRRNVITRGADLNALIGQEFELQGVRFFGTEECRPCFWMETAVGAGAERFLRGNGGLRARILSDGILRVTAAAQPQ